jgi:hypothetical protein
MAHNAVASTLAAEVLAALNDRERVIFEARLLAEKPIPLEELAGKFGVSRERVRQIEGRAFEKVQKAMKNAVEAMERPAGAVIRLKGAGRCWPDHAGGPAAHENAMPRSRLARSNASSAGLVWQSTSAAVR